MKTVYCPVIDGQIDGDNCMLICDVADKLLKPSVLSYDIDWNDEKNNLCLKCKYHDDLNE